MKSAAERIYDSEAAKRKLVTELQSQVELLNEDFELEAADWVKMRRIEEALAVLTELRDSLAH
ncbi:MAG: hypothetical protein KDC26_03115 [Armatimonadetes bacterium]|nr:hypothetical protein [Armatimonadota bacterium]